MSARDDFKAALATLSEKLIMSQPAAVPAPRVHGPVPVEALQAKCLTIPQLDAIAQIQDAVRVLAQMQGQINQLIVLHQLPTKALNLAEVGQMWHAFEGALFEHNCAAAKLRNDGEAIYRAEPVQQSFAA